MSLVALISDVHANLPALEAVLEYSRAEGASEVWNLGDHVGYNAFPEETVSLLRQIKALSVVGDYDVRVLSVERRLPRWRKTKNPVKLAAFLWARSQLSASSLDYLAALPRTLQFEFHGHTVHMTHGSPGAFNKGLSPDSDEAHLLELSKMVEAKVLLGGDSHRAFKREVGGSLFVNPGSVGRPDDGDPRAAFALLDFGGAQLRIRLLRLEYDIDRAAAALLQRGQPPQFVEMIRLGRNYNYVIQAAQDGQIAAQQ